MGRHALSEIAFRSSAIAAEVEAEGGVATRMAERQVREGKGLNPLVDPKGFGLIRRSISWLPGSGVSSSGRIVLTYGVTALNGSATPLTRA